MNEDTKKAFEHIKKNATINEAGNGHVNKKAYEEYMSECGISTDVLKAVTNAHGHLYSGLYKFNADLLDKEMDKLKDEGGEPKTAKVKTTITTTSGNVVGKMQACKTWPVPNTDKVVTKAPVFNLIVNEDKLIDKELVSDMEEYYKKKIAKL